MSDFAGKVIEELINRGRLGPSSTDGKVVDNSASKTLRWFDYFVEFFIDQHPNQEDDILYFIKDRPTGGELPLFVKRRTEGQLPKLDGLVLWEETFYVNLLAHLECEIRMTITGNTVIKQLVKKVFAEPMKGAGCDHGDFTCSFPMIYFSPNHSDDADCHLVLGQDHTLCVELRAIFGPAPKNELDPNDNNYSAWKAQKETLPLFQGAVTYPALSAVHHRKIGLRVTSPSKVLMKGPDGKGYAQVQIADAEAESLRMTDILKRLTFKEKACELKCRLDFIFINWRHVVLDLFRHVSCSSKNH